MAAAQQNEPRASASAWLYNAVSVAVRAQKQWQRRAVTSETSDGLFCGYLTVPLLNKIPHDRLQSFLHFTRRDGN